MTTSPRGWLPWARAGADVIKISPQTMKGAVPRPVSSAGTDSEQTMSVATPRVRSSAQSDLPSDQGPSVTQVGSVAGDQAVPADSLLALAADMLDDLEQVRIASENRLRQLTRTESDKDGHVRGFGLPPTYPDVVRLAALVQGIADLERQAELQMRRVLRRHPLAPWIKATVGVGEKQGARLLAMIGDPYIRPEITRKDGAIEPSRPRTVSELWAYCGYKPGQKRQKGQQSNWSRVAKTRAYLIAEKAIRQTGNGGAIAAPSTTVHARRRSPYRDVYDVRRAHTAVTHPDWSPGHSHNDALRITAKAVLRDLWRASRDIHLGQVPGDAHGVTAEVDLP